MPLLDVKPTVEAIFGSLEGTWRMRRSLNSKLPGYPSGTFTGTATFSPHSAFNSSSYLYHETGELVTEQGFQLRADRKYIYRYSPEDDKISMWFVKEDSTPGNEEVDYLFHELEFEVRDGRWIAKGDHLCNMDMYWAFHDFRLEKADDGKSRIKLWGLRYQVKGPQKDYSSDTAYER